MIIKRPRFPIASLATACVCMAVFGACNQRPTVQTPEQAIPTATNRPQALPTGEAVTLITPMLQTIPAGADTPAPTATEMLPGLPVAGVEVDSMSRPGSLDLILQTGVYWVRRNAILWSEVEPKEGARNWGALASLEKEMIDASARGLQLILVVRSTPAWAQAAPGYLCGPIQSEKLPAFGSFMHDLVARYSKPPFQVKYWEIWNEPDAPFGVIPGDSPFGCWGDSQDEFYGGGAYAEVLKAVYPQVKKADEQAQVLVGGLLLDCDPIIPPEGKDCRSSRYLEGVLRSGGGDYFDGISFHAYDYYLGANRYGNSNWHSRWDTTGPSLIQKGRYITSVLSAFGFPHKYLMNTEAGLLCGRDGHEPECQTDEFNQIKNAYLAQSTMAALEEGLRANIWYHMTGWRGTALVDLQLRPLPAYQAFTFSVSILSKAAVKQAVSAFPGVKGYELIGAGRRYWMLWSILDPGTSIQLPSQPVGIYDVTGAPLTTKQEISITPSPIYVDWGP